MTDQTQRAMAVDTGHSVLVQAPAGSGKTTLLVERYIALLAHVSAPEEILAITFTKKAAAEMRRRILTYLDPEYVSWESHETSVKQRVEAIRHKVIEWDLLNNPQRMQIRTIDSFCHSLARTMPIVGQLGPIPRPADQPARLYRSAARLALQSKEDSHEETARQQLLSWCDHDHQRVESLIVQLLAKREQWLRLIASDLYFNRAQQDAFLTAVVERLLSETHQSLMDTLTELQIDTTVFLGALSQAGQQLALDNIDSEITLLASLTAWPEPHHRALPLWRALASVLLTQAGEWKKTLNKNQGFPPKSPQKEAMTPILELLQMRPELAEQLEQAGSLPDPHYSDEEWQLLEALVCVLRQATAELNILFSETGSSDFTALSAAALAGLGDEQSGYSDLALYLDRSIEHILVDEYQDTNWTQFQLLERLIQGWDQDGHRTLFMVGDPMQSIYRFREAEVGLFVRTRRAGIQGHQPQFAQLTRNFRSSHTIVDWVNARLGPLFPKTEDIASGAIAYAHSQATIQTDGQVHIQGFERQEDEAQAVAECIEDLLNQHRTDASFNIAIIVRARSHLRFIIPTLQRRCIAFRAVKLDKLTDRPVIQDLLAITQLLRNPQDRTSLLAVFRSPMVGLTLDELVTLTGQTDAPITPSALDALPRTTQARARRVFDLIDRAKAHYGRRSLAELVEGAWHRLGGPAIQGLAGDEQDASDVQAYLDALAQAELNGLLDDWNDFIDWLKNTHTDSGPHQEDVRVEVLTMHGAKGLEWDAVIIPSLQAKPNSSDKELMYWLPFPLESGDQGVLMAPLNASSDRRSSPRVSLIKKEQRLRQNYESLRLMYVACTRAKQFLWLSAVLKIKKENDVKPANGSLLATVWPTLAESFESSMKSTSTDRIAESPATPEEMPQVANSTDSSIDQNLYRVPDDWQPRWPKRFHWTPSIEPKERETEIDFNWAGIQARRAGTVMHHLLEWVGQKGIEALSDDDVRNLTHKIPTLLAWMGASQAQVSTLAPTLTDAFHQVMRSETGRWILSAQHSDAHCEYALTGIVDGQWLNAVIDRTFIDQDGVRWIIDYKSGHHSGGDLEGFLQQEADRYRQQLLTYAQLYQQMGASKIITALYLPRHDALTIVDRLCA